MSGRDHARSFGEAVDGATVTPSIVGRRGGALGKGVGGQDRARRRLPGRPPRARARLCGRASTILSAGGGSPITPVEEMKTSFGSHPSKRAAVAAGASTTSLPARPVKVFELPELTTIAACDAARRGTRGTTGPAPRRSIELGEHAGDGAARRQFGEHHIVAAGVADARRRGRRAAPRRSVPARGSPPAPAARRMSSAYPPAAACRRARPCQKTSGLATARRRLRILLESEK